MGDLLIRTISEALKHDIAAAADLHGRSLSDQAKELLRKALMMESDVKAAAELSAYDALRAAFGDCLMTDEDNDEFTTVIEESRKRIFERPGFEFG
ncbi:plasmid stabilization protein [Pararhizobium antarcticum]|uniref:Plasmid stabilization protein n=1 Tax=Pararhizobium antarcticum TaxID=1798805 RepID=A0A657LKR3_9HYPH|nr:plasmid stabilization protein [Pararhizobium antarcticum]OJF90492.1 plasmid stabilization protein [Pararhizobium antarcticum]OJF98568.1 plasmid stabilization protein [Rhizobium sp. 58]